MPYCPKCDMEFVDGITVCTDCGGPLLESEEAARTLAEEEKARQKAEEARLMEEEARRMEAYFSGMEAEEADASESPDQQKKQPAQRQAAPRVYVKKEQKYDDLKSSASAFLIVGLFLLAVSVLLWTGIIRLPMAGITKLLFQGVLTLLGLLSLGVSVSSTKSAQKLKPQIAAENNATRELTSWFLDTYDQEAIDRAIQDAQELAPEELSLKRFQIIQDFLITNHDLPDPAYVDALSEDIYSKLFD